MRIIADRTRSLPAPVGIVHADLIRPTTDGPRAWLKLLPDEVPPVTHPGGDLTLVWASIWTRHPELTIHLTCTPDGAGCRLRFVVHAPDATPGVDDDAWIGHIRRRLNQLLFGELRFSYGQ